MWCGRGAADYGTRGNYDPPKLRVPLFFIRVAVVHVSWQGGRKSTRARRMLSEAKTQRLPHRAREIVR